MDTNFGFSRSPEMVEGRLQLALKLDVRWGCTVCLFLSRAF